ncbi:adenylosuccinate lyase [Gloeobacter violaceus]|uniref:Adenylosuccinate lyase n=1 Tax=Gloeobacter violaceus (strain ATCC 29082 / PCC 7421) TaxID=251221 RepID=Q7NPL2_GLOVI|nr:adenylosuccinate lyase [Gloeobacter violaceus]BAC87984.1 adenylosuccinate lyase [Gloeobacter violaceus PCC 7421]
MIERYTLPEMGALWTEEQKYRNWLKVELAACEAMVELGEIPQGAWQEIRTKAGFDVGRIAELEAEVRHDVIAFLTSVNEHVGPAGRFIHLGLTSSDVLDTALALQLVQTLDVLALRLEELIAATRAKAREHRDTVMIGRTHGIHAEPITFGFKLAGWLAELARHAERLRALRPRLAAGKLSGAVGTYANLDPRVEARACELLGLVPDTASTQVISRDRHAEFVQALALTAGSIERFAVEIRNLQRTDVLEVEEYFAAGQKGSSAMPHKRNPIASEQLTGLARIVRSNATAALENMALWHERDISHSSVERVILPDSAILVHYMLVKFTALVEKLAVYPENMARNLHRYGGVVFSQRVLLALVAKGLTREEAYRIVQTNAHKAWNREGGDFRALIEADPEVQILLAPAELAACFEPRHHLKHLDTIFARLEI